MSRDEYIKTFTAFTASFLKAQLPKMGTELGYLRWSKAIINKTIDHILAAGK